MRDQIQRVDGILRRMRTDFIVIRGGGRRPTRRSGHARLGRAGPREPAARASRERGGHLPRGCACNCRKTRGAGLLGGAGADERLRALGAGHRGAGRCAPRTRARCSRCWSPRACAPGAGTGHRGRPGAAVRTAGGGVPGSRGGVPASSSSVSESDCRSTRFERPSEPSHFVTSQVLEVSLRAAHEFWPWMTNARRARRWRRCSPPGAHKVEIGSTRHENALRKAGEFRRTWVCSDLAMPETVGLCWCVAARGTRGTAPSSSSRAGHDYRLGGVPSARGPTTSS